MWVDHMVDQFSTYLYQKRGFYYFSRRVPKEVQHCHLKQRIVLALNTRSRAKALKYSQVICQRLDERWLPMRLDALGFGNVMGVMVLAECDISPCKHRIHHVIEAMPRITYVTLLVNALFWSTLWSTH